MKTLDLNTWADFTCSVAEIRASFRNSVAEGSGGRKTTFENRILFRGHAASNWGLKTTLDRSTTSPMTVERYLQRANSCVNEIESVTGRKWNLKSFPDILKEIRETQKEDQIHLPHYDFLVYLRHHGFPSPLLDWTTSPFVAAYFAFEQKADADRVAIFAFIEPPIRTEFVGQDRIQTHGPYVTTHTRHFLQKAWYTTATRFDNSSKSHTFCSHEDVQFSSDNAQDILIRFTIPRKERARALEHLDEYNINHYTLFNSEEALIRTMGIRRFDIECASE